MRNPSRLAAALCLCALACDDQSEIPAITVDQTPVALDTQLVFVDSDNQRAHLLDVSQARPSASTHQVELPAGASYSERRINHDEVLILCAGQRDSADVSAEQAALVALDAAGKTRTYEFGTTPFNTLKQSDDGRYVILYRSGKDDSRTLNNPNELLVIDLDKDPTDDGAITRKTPDGLGHPLTQVIVSPQLRILEEDRRLLVVLSAAEVTLFDLTHLDRRATIVQLDETRQVNPTQVLFGKQNATLYVRAQNSDNIFMFRFEPRGENPQGNDFRPTINALGGGSGPRDMALFGRGADERLLVVALGSSQALVIDPSSSKTNALHLNAPAEHIVLFKGLAPLDKQIRTRALLYAGDTRTGLTFLDLYDLDTDPEDRLEALKLDNAIGSVIPLLGTQSDLSGESLPSDAAAQPQIAFLHDQGVTLLNLVERTLTPISSSTSLKGAVFDPDRKRLWVGTAGQDRIGTLDLDTRATDEVRVDASIRSIMPMFEVNRLVVLHESPIGYVTLLDLDKPSRASAVSVRGFFISDVLDRGGR